MTTLELWGSVLAFFMLVGLAVHTGNERSRLFQICTLGMLVAWIGFVVVMVGRLWDAGG